jgi:glycerol-3-phosphate acyltransferase PlsX
VSRIVLDAVGGDHGTRATVEGARLALERGDVTAGELILVGPADEVAAAVRAAGIADGQVEILDAPDRLDGTETPVEAARRRPRNPVAVGLEQVKEGRADSFVSAGSTGLVVATAMFSLSCLEGIRRPGIAATMPGQDGPFVVIDVGANPQPKPQHLLAYALMGAAYFHDLFGKERPRVGLLNIGSEEGKGHALARESRALLSSAQADFEFLGNVEGPDIYGGRCDVVVSDGFTGNVFLKVSEGVAEYLLRTFTQLLDEEQVLEERKQRILRKVVGRVDYSEYGGALLLGVEGIVTICHGRSNGRAIGNAIRFAHRAVGAHVNQHIVQAAARAMRPSEQDGSA